MNLTLTWKRQSHNRLIVAMVGSLVTLLAIIFASQPVSFETMLAGNGLLFRKNLSIVILVAIYAIFCLLLANYYWANGWNG